MQKSENYVGNLILSPILRVSLAESTSTLMQLEWTVMLRYYLIEAVQLLLTAIQQHKALNFLCSKQRLLSPLLISKRCAASAQALAAMSRLPIKPSSLKCRLIICSSRVLQKRFFYQTRCISYAVLNLRSQTQQRRSITQQVYSYSSTQCD